MVEVAHSLQAWATALGMERRTLESRLVKAGYSPPKKDGNKIPAKKIFVAIVGDKEAETIRALKLDNEERERKAAEQAGQLCQWEDVQALLNQFLVAPLVTAMDSAPKDVDWEWLEKVVRPLLRQKLTPPKKK